MGYLALAKKDSWFGFISNKKDKGGDLTTRPDTPDGALTPDNPGAIVPLRSMPVPTEPRYFDKLTAEALHTIAQKKKEMLPSTKQGYEALGTASDCDAEVVADHSNFQIKDAGNALSQAQSQAGVKSFLSELRPGYEEIDAGLGFASEKANKRIDWIEQDLDEAMEILAA
ncbi:MAG: hypothetical protein AAFO04_19360 [Cyanobacteria bacterium J06592_8]